jgi:hypothetical protein
MFRYMSVAAGLDSIQEGACDFAHGDVMVRLASMVRWERKAKKRPNMLPMNWMDTASAFFISRTVMSVRDEQRRDGSPAYGEKSPQEARGAR